MAEREDASPVRTGELSVLGPSASVPWGWPDPLAGQTPPSRPEMTPGGGREGTCSAPSIGLEQERQETTLWAPRPVLARGRDGAEGAGGGKWPPNVHGSMASAFWLDSFSPQQQSPTQDRSAWDAGNTSSTGEKVAKTRPSPAAWMQGTQGHCLFLSRPAPPHCSSPLGQDGRPPREGRRSARSQAVCRASLHTTQVWEGGRGRLFPPPPCLGRTPRELGGGFLAQGPPFQGTEEGGSPLSCDPAQHHV